MGLEKEERVESKTGHNRRGNGMAKPQMASKEKRGTMKGEGPGVEKCSPEEEMGAAPITRAQAWRPSSPGWEELALWAGAAGAKARGRNRQGAAGLAGLGTWGPTFLY